MSARPAGFNRERLGAGIPHAERYSTAALYTLSQDLAHRLSEAQSAAVRDTQALAREHRTAGPITPERSILNAYARGYCGLPCIHCRGSHAFLAWRAGWANRLEDLRDDA